jgi:hypothetical protein
MRTTLIVLYMARWDYVIPASASDAICYSPCAACVLHSPWQPLACGLRHNGLLAKQVRRNIKLSSRSYHEQPSTLLLLLLLPLLLSPAGHPQPGHRC